MPWQAQLRRLPVVALAMGLASAISGNAAADCLREGLTRPTGRCAVSPRGLTPPFLRIEAPAEAKGHVLNLVDGHSSVELRYVERRYLHTAGVVVFAAGLGLAAGAATEVATLEGSRETAKPVALPPPTQPSRVTSLQVFVGGTLLTLLGALGVGLPLWFVSGATDVGFTSQPPGRPDTPVSPSGWVTRGLPPVGTRLWQVRF